ncbi:thioredoxin [Alphaproteobacteria bacterium]|nr:thioredoxin [Alphaproteobacteria bacterium]
MNKNLNIVEINETDFEEKVLKDSSVSLVLVDFWAPWCGPCKQLTPLLEKVVNNSNGKVKLVKINIDQNQQIAAQLKIQSIPAVFAFKDGQPVNAFQGVIPEKKIIEFIEKSLGEKIEDDHTEFYESVKNLILNNKYNEAKNLLENFLVENPKEFESFALYINCLSGLEQFEEADDFYNSLSKEALENNEVKGAIQKLSIKKKNSKGPALEELINQLKNNPADINIIMNLADKYFASDMIDEAFDLLLLNYKNHKEKIKIKFIEFFSALGNHNLKTVEYRKKFSSIMFS